MTAAAESAVTPPIETLIAAAACEAIRAAIRDNNGNEVFFVGHVDTSGLVNDVEAYAFGNKQAVPALAKLARAGDVIIHNHPGGLLDPSNADVSIASQLGDQSVGCYIVDNDCSRIRVVVKAFREETLHLLAPEDIASFFSPDGILAKSLKDYDFRPQQVDMAREVAEAFNDNHIAVIEAGTGVGKSMAYLLPAILWSVRNKDRIVISTNTINLQEQIIHKDLPLLRKRLGVEFTSEILMGRNNYLCQRKLDYARGERLVQESPEVRAQLQTIYDWSGKTREGCRTELNTDPSYEAWELVMCEGDNCLRIKCPFYSKCYFYNARRRASRADLLVVNHHLMMSDLALRRETSNYSASAVLPPFTRAIFDEAHNIEDVATEYFGFRTSRFAFVRALGRLSSTRGRGKGVLSHLLKAIEDAARGMPKDVIDRVREAFYIELPQLRDELEEEVRVQFDNIAEDLLRMEGRMNLKPREEIKRRVTQGIARGKFWRETVATAVARVVNAVVRLCQSAEKSIALLEDFPPKAREELASPIMELRALCGRLQENASRMNLFHAIDESYCCWFELRQLANGTMAVAPCGAPLEIRRSMREAVYTPCKTVVMTSATLTVDKQFDYLLRQLGLNAAEEDEHSPAQQELKQRVKIKALATPFNYEEQAFVGVPVDMPEPTQAEFPAALEDFTRRALIISQGHAFVLFTSYGLLEKLHRQLQPEFAAMNYLVLKQRDSNRHQLLEMFKSGRNPVLFATSSFWEGVDVKGDALQLLLLARLPFQVPSEPILEARAEMIDQRGGDSFMEMTVPSAIIRFRQGFGRLIRSRQDRGAVLILDSRVATKRYGKQFLRSLPTGNICLERTDDMLDQLHQFFSVKG